MAAVQFHYETPAPEGDWIGWRAHFELAGAYHHASSINDFVRSTKHLKAGEQDPTIAVVREPQNRFDRNALRLTATWEGQSWTLGYVPKDLAAGISVEFPADMPLAARLIRVTYAGSSVYVKVQLLVPSKKARGASNPG